jgi:hypothetical protein
LEITLLKYKKMNRKFFWIAGTVLWTMVGWWFFLPHSQAMVEYYFSRHWYRWMLSWITPATQAVRFPAIIFLIVALLIFINILWFRAWKRGGGKEALFQGFRNLFLIAPILLVWFIALWGAGYRRIPIVQQLELNTSKVSDDAAAVLQLQLLKMIERDLTPVHERNVNRAVASISAAMSRTVQHWESKPIRLPNRVKLFPKGVLMSGGVSGLCSPFTLEPIVDGGLPDVCLVYTSAHELGHVAGYCAEDEATFIGFVAGLKAEDRFARYCCALNAYLDLISRLEPGEIQPALKMLPELTRQDLLKTQDAYQKYHIAFLDKLETRAYNRYLQVQGISDGVKSYSRGVQLLIFGWRKGLILLR